MTTPLKIVLSGIGGYGGTGIQPGGHAGGHGAGGGGGGQGFGGDGGQVFAGCVHEQPPVVV